MSIKQKKRGIVVPKNLKQTRNNNKRSIHITPEMKKSMYYDPDGFWKIINRAL